MQERNVSIEAFRFIFMTILCLWHMETGLHFQYHGYLVVEFFFMLSGVLLYNSFLRHPEVGVLDFTIRKFKRFWIGYVLAMLLTLLVYHRGILSQLATETESNLERLFSYILQLTAETFMVRYGIFCYMINHPTWYLSVLLAVGALLYALLRHYNRKAISFIIPLSSLIIYGYFFPMGTSNSIEHWDTVNGFSLSMLRGWADMGLGILIYELLRLKKNVIEVHVKWLNATSIFSLVIILLLFILNVQKDSFVIIFMPVFIMGLLCKQSCWNQWLTSKIWIFLGGLSYEMLLIHMFVRGPFVKFEVYQWMNPWLLGISYMALVLLCSYLLKYTSMKIQKRLGW